MSRTPRAVAVLALASASVFTMLARGQAPSRFNERLVSAFAYRNVGPFRMGARTSDIAVPAAPAKEHLYTFYVVVLDRRRVEDDEQRHDVRAGVRRAEQARDRRRHAWRRRTPNIVWVGTGDAFTSRSSYAGDGVYKSTDAGKTWKNMGLEGLASHRAHRDPSDESGHRLRRRDGPSLLGRTTSAACFKTTNGGATWEKVLYVSDEASASSIS